MTCCGVTDSVPGNKNFTTADLSYLTVNQALDDVKNFMDHFTYNSQNNFQWFVFGGSYAGAMSAWFHVKVWLPPLVCHGSPPNCDAVAHNSILMLPLAPWPALAS